MARDLTIGTITQIDAQSKRPVFLVEIYLNSYTLRFAGYNTNITFPTGGDVYIAKAMEFTRPSSSIEGQINRITIKFDNVSKDMMSYANGEDFRGKKIIIKRIYLDNITDALQYVEIFSGYMERPSNVSRQWLTVPVTTGKPLNRKALPVKYQRLCPWVFAGIECDTDGLSSLNTVSGTADSGTSTTFIDNALIQSDGFWEWGKVIITKDGEDYVRTVTDFNSSTDEITFDVDLPFSIDTNCTYAVSQGCDHTWLSCLGSYASGPVSDNTLNFGGFLHVTKREDAG